MTLYEILQISMETSLVVNISKLLQDDSTDYLSECVELYIANRNYDVALKIAKLANLPVNDILKAEWTHQYQMLVNKEDVAIEDKDITLFVAQCSEAFKKASVTFKDATDFLVQQAENITDGLQKFYSYRIIMSWFEESLEYGARREEIEHRMWEAYFDCEPQNDVFLNTYFSTLHFILNGQKDPSVSRKIGLVDAEKPFSLTLGEIEIESDLGNIENVVMLEDAEAIDAWRKVNTVLNIYSRIRSHTHTHTHTYNHAHTHTHTPSLSLPSAALDCNR